MKKVCKNGHDTPSCGRDKRGLCIQCRKEYGIRFSKEHPERAREAQLKSLFGLTAVGYAELLKKQNGLCAGCGRAQVEFIKTFCVDHSHNCCSGKKSCGKCIRGLLCVPCNLILGYAKDKVQTLKNLITYLEK
jgi:hypothetical protein